VNLYVSTSANWEAAGVRLEMNTDFPMGQSASLKLALKSPRKFTLALRRPYWAGTGFSVKVNCEAVKDLPKAGSYVEIARTWKAGDTVELVLPKTLRAEPLPDNPNRLAVLWGPLVLAGDLGAERQGEAGDIRPENLGPSAPVLVATAAQPAENWLKPVAGKPGTFLTSSVGLKQDITFVPFYQLPRREYAIYWDMFTPQEWQKKSEAYAAEQEKRTKLEAATVAFAQPGQMQAERDFNQQGEDSSPVQWEDHYGRRGTKWFSFDLPLDNTHPMVLIATYSNGGRRKGSFTILVDGMKVGEQTAERHSPEEDLRFFDVEYAIPAELVQGKQKVTIRFEAPSGGEIPGVFGIRMVRGDAAR
jgi:hypothetical protein